MIEQEIDFVMLNLFSETTKVRIFNCLDQGNKNLSMKTLRKTFH